MKEPKKNSWKKPLIIGVIAVLILGGLFLLGVLPKINRNKKIEEMAAHKKSSLTEVTIVQVKVAEDSTGIELPADIRAYRETFIYARVNGYIKKWYSDIGSFVKQGDLLAELETPDLDQNLVQARSGLELAKVNLDRVQSVTMPGALSKQEADQYKTAYLSNLAMVKQLEATVSFKHVRAPFSGMVTQRNIDEGTLISAGSTQPMFKLEQTNQLRIFINVPQNYINLAIPGRTIEVILKKFPLEKKDGRIVRTAGSLDPVSRTLLCEIHLDNKDHQFMPGMYVQIHLKPDGKNTSLRIPANTLVTRNDGPQVAILNKDSTVKLATIMIGRDYGQTLEILDGLKGGEKLVENPSEKIRNGLKVKVLTTENKHHPQSNPGKDEKHESK